MSTAPNPSSTAVSVVIPCFNLGRYLDEAVESVLAQTHQDFEILIVDDGSTDPLTRRIVSRYAERGPDPIRVLTTPNRGLPAAKNLGLEHTSGPYVCMFDADDRLAPEFLEKSVAPLEREPATAFVSHWFRTFGDEVWDWTPTSCELPALLDANTVNGAALVRRSALEAVGGFDETMRDGCEDWDLWLTLVEQGYRGMILPEILFYYRRRADSMSRQMMDGDRHPKLFKRLVEKHADSYRIHLSSVLMRRERDLSHMRREIDQLERDYHRDLEPERRKLRDDVAAGERHLAREATATHARTDGERSQQLEVEVTRLRGEVDALRDSLSWRLTAPLRALYDRLRGGRRKR